MTSLDELAARVVALEEQALVNAQVRAAIDGDLAEAMSKLRAMHHLTQAVSITQAEQTAKLEALREDVRDIRTALGRHGGYLQEIALSLRELLNREEPS